MIPEGGIYSIRWQESAFLIFTREEIITGRKPYSHSIVEGGFEEMS